MSRTDSDVIVTQYRAEFCGEPWQGHNQWTLGPWQSCETLRNRRAWTVARDILDSYPDDKAREYPGTARDITDDILRRYTGLALPIARGEAIVRAIVIPDTRPSRYGRVLVIEERAK